MTSAHADTDAQQLPAGEHRSDDEPAGPDAAGRATDPPDPSAAVVDGPSRSGADRASWWQIVAYYGSLALITTLGAIKAIGLTVHPLNVPLVYYGDALSGGTQFKTVLARGWYEYNPDLGAPWGQHYHDFPLADNFGLMVAHVLGWFTDQWAVAFNVYYLMTFPLAAIAGAWFVRLVGASRTISWGMGLLYAFAPYHFWRNEGHLYLAAYYPVPLVAGLIYLALAGRPLWGRRERGRTINPLTWLTARTIWTVLSLALVGTASSYYSVFSLFFFVFVIFVVAVSRRAWRAIGGVLAAMATLVVTMVANMAPDILYNLGKPTNYAALIRSPQSTEIYAMKLASLLLPVTWERIPFLARIRQNYDGTFPLPSENPMLGIVGAVGLAYLIVVLFAAAFRPVRPGAEAGRYAVQIRLAGLSIFGLFVGMVGGFSTLFALAVTDDIRGWNRISIFLALFAVASVALLVDAGLDWLRPWVGARLAARDQLRLTARGRSWLSRGAAIAVCFVLVAVGLFDEVMPVNVKQMHAITAQWRSDQKYVDQIQAEVPPQTMILQLPYLPFPETPNILNLADSNPFRPYLHSTDLRWSYGGIKGRPLADWAESVSSDPVARMLVEVGAAGFGGVHVDRAGYTAADDAKLESQLAEQLGVQPIVSGDNEFAFFSMSTFDSELNQRYPAAELANIGSHAVAHPVAYWQDGFGGPVLTDGHAVMSNAKPDPKLYIDNPRSMKTSVTITFGLSSPQGATSAVVRWPDGSVQTVALASTAVSVSRTVEVAPGRTFMQLTYAPGEHVRAIPHTAQFQLTDERVADDVLTGFSL